MSTTTDLYNQELAKVPKEVQIQVNLSYDIADRIAALLEERGLSHKAFAKMMGKTETEVSRWVGGPHNFTLSTLAKISATLGENIVSVAK